MTNDVFSQYPETAVLSLILQDSELIEHTSSLKPFMFSSTPHRNIYKTIIDLYNDGLTPEFGLLVSKLQENSMLNECGGDSYLKFLYNQSFERDNIKEFVEFVINSYKARQVITIANSVPKMLVDVGQIDNVISQISASFEDLSSHTGDSVFNMEDASRLAWDELVKKVNNPNKIEWATAIPDLDGVTGGYWPGDVWIIAGRPGMGKSAFMCNSVLNKIPSLIFSLEMKKESLLYRMASIISGVPIFSMRLGSLNQQELNAVSAAFKQIKDIPTYIDDGFVTSVDQVASTIRKYHRLYGVQVVHVDYVGLLAERSKDATNDIGRISRTLKNLARDLGIAIVMYSQLNRQVEYRDDKRPVLSDLRQSGDLEQDADVVIFLYRDELYNRDTKLKGTLELLVRKQRQGPVGVVPVSFVETTNKIAEKK
jgi:replicative DNA helicase